MKSTGLPRFCVSQHLPSNSLDEAESSYLSKCGRSDPHVLATLHISGWDSGALDARAALRGGFAGVTGSTEKAVAISSVTGATEQIRGCLWSTGAGYREHQDRKGPSGEPWVAFRGFGFGFCVSRVSLNGKQLSEFGRAQAMRGAPFRPRP